jgi:hypothetical protein
MTHIPIGHLSEKETPILLALAATALLFLHYGMTIQLELVLVREISASLPNERYKYEKAMRFNKES